jgi:MiaB-like tRNA modifying enzyme
MNKRVYSEVYGCSANVADQEIALGLLKKNGFKFVNDAKQSDLNIIFTCTVKTPTLNRMIYRIKELTKLNKPLIVAGCMPKTEKEIIEKINPNTSMIGPNSIEKIVDITHATMGGKKVTFLEDLKKPKVCLPRVRKNPIINIITVSTGCLNRCSFCSVNFARGKLFSFPEDMIVEEAKRAINDGCKELYITSQDNSCYGRDIGTNLTDLLDKICKVDGKFLIRVGMMNPLHLGDILNDLICVYQNEKIFKFLHLPFQSGSNKILKAMNRGYTVRDFKNIVKNFVKNIPSLTLSTDVIAGFPGETEKDFQMTIELIKKVKPDIVNVSKFGARPRTKAAEMEQLPVNVINQRSKELMGIVKKIQLEKNKKWIGWEGEVLIDEIKNKSIIGRNFAYKTIISKEGKLGEFRNIKIENVSSTSLFSEL